MILRCLFEEKNHAAFLFLFPGRLESPIHIREVKMHRLSIFALLCMGLTFVFLTSTAQADCPHKRQTDHLHCAEPEIVSPEPGTTLSGTSETFTWVSNGYRYGKARLWVGTSVGASNIFDSGVLLKEVTSQTVNGLPSDGSTVYVRLRIKRDRVWYDVADYQYTAVTAP